MPNRQILSSYTVPFISLVTPPPSTMSNIPYRTKASLCPTSSSPTYSYITKRSHSLRCSFWAQPQQSSGGGEYTPPPRANMLRRRELRELHQILSNSIIKMSCGLFPLYRPSAVMVVVLTIGLMSYSEEMFPVGLPET
jgi:hypothetical protein